MNQGHIVEGRAGLPGGGEIAYQVRRHRQGTPLLLLRPLGGSMALWGSFGDALSEHFSVIAFDYRGMGASRNEASFVTTEALARDALALLDHLAIERAHVFGISLGGMVATQLAILAPRRVARLCLASAPARGLELTRNGIRRELALAACLAQPHADLEARMVTRVLSRRFRLAHPERVQEIERIVRAAPCTPRIVLVKHALAAILHDARQRVGEIQQETLVLAGEDDRLLGVAPARALAASLSRARFQSVEGAGHALTLEQPLATASIVAAFLAA